MIMGTLNTIKRNTGIKGVSRDGVGAKSSFWRTGLLAAQEWTDFFLMQNRIRIMVNTSCTASAMPPHFTYCS